MKIIGRTDTGYLCQISETEIGIITGNGKYPEYGKPEAKDKYKKDTGRQSLNDKIPTNTEINVVAGLDYIETIRGKLITTRKTAKELRELADMLDNPVPTIIEPPGEAL